MRLAATIALLAALLTAQDSRPASRPESRRAAESRGLASLADVADAVGELEDLANLAARAAAVAAAAPNDEETPYLLTKLGFAWQRVGRDDKALECFHETANHPLHRTTSTLLIVFLHTKNGDYGKGVAAVEHTLASGEDEHDANLLYGTLAMLEEKRGEWRKALEAAEKTKPLVDADWAGPVARQLRIARCRFHLGEVDAALKLLEDSLATGQVSEVWQSVMVDVATAYAEFSAKSGRLQAARNFAATLPADRRAILLDAIEKAKAEAAELKPASRPDSRPK